MSAILFSIISHIALEVALAPRMSIGAAQKDDNTDAGSAAAEKSQLPGARIQIWGLLPGIVLLLATIAISGILTSDNWISSGEINRAQKIQSSTFQFLTLMQDAETGQRGYLLTGKAIYLAPFNAGVERVPAALVELTDLAQGDADLMREITELSALVNQKISELRATIAAFDRGGPATALPIVLNDSGRTAMVRIQTIAEEILNQQRDALTGRTARWRQNNALLVASGGAALLLTIAMAVLIVMTLRRHATALGDARAKLIVTNIDLEDRVAERTADLKEANEEIRRYAHVVSHDLRSPLVNIMGYSSELELVRLQVLDILAKDGGIGIEAREQLKKLNEDFEEALSFIKQSNLKMDRLINAILKLARSGQREFRYESLDMSAVIASIRATQQHQISQRDISFEISPLPQLYADRLAIEQIFGNLIENAIKYLKPQVPGRISFTAMRRNDDITFIVEDNGRGIAAKDIDRIFDPFRRAGMQDQPGEGIGLAHVRMLVRRLGGNISCQSDLGRGSRFLVTLPSKGV